MRDSLATTTERSSTHVCARTIRKGVGSEPKPLCSKKTIKKKLFGEIHIKGAILKWIIQ